LIGNVNAVENSGYPSRETSALPGARGTIVRRVPFAAFERSWCSVPDDGATEGGEPPEGNPSQKNRIGAKRKQAW
jgi:hypothetical protein